MPQFGDFWRTISARFGHIGDKIFAHWRHICYVLGESYFLVKTVLRYDFEMFPVGHAPCAAEGRKTGKGLTSQGQARSNTVVAFFRDPDTTNAVTAAPPIVRLFLEEAGFELSGVDPEPADVESVEQDVELRRALAAQLTAALSNRALKKALARAANESEFDVAAFVSAVVAKEPVENARRPIVVTPRRPCELRAKGIKSRARPA